MESTTATIEATTDVQTVPEKLANYLINTATEGSTSTEETYRKLIEATWQQATQTRKRIPVKELVTNYAVESNNFTERIRFAHEVAHNTLKKMTHGFPESLQWANIPAHDIRITGIYRTMGGYNAKPENILSRIASGKLTVNQHDTVRFQIVYYGKTYDGELPVRLLNNDPIAVAQYVRNICKAYAREQEASEARSLAAQKRELEKKMAELTKQMDRVTQQQAKKIK